VINIIKVIKMELGEIIEHNFNLQNLYWEIDFAIRETLNILDIAGIDKTTRAKLINAVVQDKQVLSGDYGHDDLIRIIRNELNSISGM
jgi:hypothetical protein